MSEPARSRKSRGKKSSDGDRRIGRRGEAVAFSCISPPTEEESQSLVVGMPPLAGRPLPAPRFFQTGWQAQQKFTWRDDPDRVSLPWVAPDFLREKDPAAQATHVEELPVVSRTGAGSFARVVRNVLSHKDCYALLSHVNTKGYTPALLNIGGGSQQLVPGARDGHRAIVDSPELVRWLLQVLLPYLPPELEDGSRLVELNERCRFLCYTRPAVPCAL